MSGAAYAAVYSSGVLLPALAWGSKPLSSGTAVYYLQAAAAWVPASALFVFVNWFCNKMFKHNT